MSRNGDPGSSGTTAPSTGPDKACLEVPDRPEAIPLARRFVQGHATQFHGQEITHSAALVASELTANAVQHGAGPIVVCVSGSGGVLRIEVADADPRPPIRPAQSASNMTGRGLALVEAVSTRWGVDRAPGGGKRVWAELSTNPAAATGQPLNDDLLDWTGVVDGAPGYFTVRLGDVPTNLLIEAKAHIDNLVREFTLASAAGSDSPGPGVPVHLAKLIETVVFGFAEARDAIKRQALAAAQRDEPRTNLVLHLPLSAAGAGEAYLAALDEADTYSRAARLLTLETPAAHRLFRRWYVEAVIRQLRQVAAGRRPEPVEPFEETLLEEVQRLAARQRITERTARLQRVTAALARARTPEDVANVVVSEGVNALGADGGGLLVPAPDGEHIAVPGAVGYGEELVGALREERLDAPLPAATVLRTGDAVWLESQEERDEQFPALHGFEAATVSMCAVPLSVGGTLLGALRFSFNERRLFDDDERSFVLALAAQTAQTLQRSELYAAERQASISLQRALLPRESPLIPDWDVGTYYQPAGNQEAGGDFYDLLPLRDGRFVAMIGDVMGRGIEAAAAMAQTRTMLRAYAVVDPEPVDVFNNVDRFFEVMDYSQLVTVLYLLVDQATGRIAVGNAGHLPPLLVDHAGARTTELSIGTPFGVGGFERTASELHLPPGTSLIAITDGLVERRDEDIDIGIKRLVEQVTQLQSVDAAKLMEALTTEAPGPEGDDDITVLVLHHLGG